MRADLSRSSKPRESASYARCNAHVTGVFFGRLRRNRWPSKPLPFAEEFAMKNTPISSHLTWLPIMLAGVLTGACQVSVGTTDDDQTGGTGAGGGLGGSSGGSAGSGGVPSGGAA